jgi:hypothetical protein
MSDQSEQLKSIAGQVLSGNALDSFVENSLIAAFTDKDGNVDEEKVYGHLTAIFAAGQPQQQRQEWGQSSTAGGPPKRPGDNARAELRKRFGVDVEAPKQPELPGDRARNALKKRHSVKNTS